MRIAPLYPTESHDPSPHDVRSALKRELISPNRWRTRIVVIGMASIAGLVVVAFTWLAESSFSQFKKIFTLA